MFHKPSPITRGLERSSDAPSPNELTARSESGHYAPGRALFLDKWDKEGLLAHRVSFDIYAVCTHTSISQVEVNESVPRMNFLEFLASLGGVLGLMLGLGVLQLVQLADQFVQNFLEKATSRNLEKSQPTIFCV